MVDDVAVFVGKFGFGCRCMPGIRVVLDDDLFVKGPDLLATAEMVRGPAGRLLNWDCFFKIVLKFLILPILSILFCKLFDCDGVAEILLFRDERWSSLPRTSCSQIFCCVSSSSPLL